MTPRLPTALVAATALALALPATAAAQPTTPRIHDVQGSTRLSPLAGQVVAGVPGVVTAVRAFGSARGFWFADPEPDADAATSEGLFVFTGATTPDVAVGDAVQVGGTVAEFRPTASGETPETTPNQSITQLTGATWTVTAQGRPLPPAEVLAPGTVPATYATAGTDEDAPLDPAASALDFYESREGMVLRVQDARVVGRTDEFDGLWVTTEPDRNPTARGGTLYASYDDPNGGRLKVESLVPRAEQPFPVADVGDRLAGTTEGPLDYTRFGGYVLQATTLGEHVPGGLTRETAAPAAPGQLSVGTYNVENLFAGDDPAEFARLATGVVTNMAAPDVIALEEIQDNSGPADDGIVAADATLRRFVEAIVAAGGPRYDFRLVDPEDQADGGQPGGNIRVAFLFDPARVAFVDRPGATPTTAVRAVPAAGGAALSISPGRVAPTDPAWDASRKPLAGEFSVAGHTVFVIANHFASKGGDQPLHSRTQPPLRSSEEQRGRQAAVLRGFVDELLAVDPRAEVVVLGDLNDYAFSPSVQTLTAGGALRALIDTLPPEERYGYVFDGNSQALDHVLVSPAVTDPGYDVVHINAEFADQASDHDPQVVRFVPGAGAR
ncbi:endonuclease/exonuclease/phosphatase family protein [Pseudonocardia humida]|uniref:endonuclease/exonuclease/phosphatase family protein n=1 Tax=Pseudonocardia humida TaxID=2800819 RepID=UPI00207C11BD|nr:endonuclease/exonuclease/phosphatase family protein [Pseudonocardia humida]